MIKRSERIRAYNIQQVRLGRTAEVRKSVEEMNGIDRRMIYGQLTLDEIMDSIQVAAELTMHMETTETKE